MIQIANYMNGIMGTINLAKELAKIMKNYIFPFLMVGSALWALWLGVEFFRAKDQGARNTAKARLIKALATVAIVMMMYGIMRVATGDIFNVSPPEPTSETPKEPDTVGTLPSGVFSLLTGTGFGG